MDPKSSLPEQSVQKPHNFTDIHERLNQSQTIISWKAPLRPYKKRGKKVMRFFLALALLLSVIIFFFGDTILLVPIWAVLFLFYVMTITPPPIVENKVTRFGIETAGVTLRWEALSHFYFNQRFGYDILTVVTVPPYSMHSYMVIPSEAVKQKVASILAEHLMYDDKPHRTFSDRMIDLMAQLIPEDDEEEDKKVEKTPVSTINASTAHVSA